MLSPKSHWQTYMKWTVDPRPLPSTSTQVSPDNVDGYLDPTAVKKYVDNNVDDILWMSHTYQSLSNLNSTEVRVRKNITVTITIAC